MPEFDFNGDCVGYCKLDVRVLVGACTKFLKQTFQWDQQMIARFGVSPAYKEGYHQPHFHAFVKTIPTLGSYS